MVSDGAAGGVWRWWHRLVASAGGVGNGGVADGDRRSECLAMVRDEFGEVSAEAKAEARFDPQTRLLTGTNDGTLVNFFLRQFGRMSEQTLCVVLLLFQSFYEEEWDYWNLVEQNQLSQVDAKKP
nr:UDP-N-acetylglucosamine--dolichyl-phosphate N-acetylglucosaminephosphotransferase [Ipomoea batatas]